MDLVVVKLSAKYNPNLLTLFRTTNNLLKNKILTVNKILTLTQHEIKWFNMSHSLRMS